MSDTTDPDDTPRTKAERLAIAGEVAPILRRAAAAPRRVTLVGKDGKPTGTATHVDVAKGLLKRSAIEFDVRPEKRPQWVKCKTCGRPVKVHKNGVLPLVCRPHTHLCPVCKKPMKHKKSVCAFGKTCKKCRVTKQVKDAAARRRRVSDDDLRRLVVPGVTYQEVADRLGVSLSAVYSGARRLGLGSDRRRGNRRGSSWSDRRRQAEAQRRA